MKSGYELPSDRSAIPGWLKMTLAWGIPIVLIHVVLIWGISGGCAGGSPDKAAPVENTALPSHRVIPPDLPAVSSDDHPPPATTRKAKALVPYNFDGAIQGDLPLPQSTLCQTGIMVDADNHRVLWAKNANKAVPVASMVKMMTLLLAFEEMEKRPEITLATPVSVSVEAYKIGGSQVWLDPREVFPLGELLKTVAIKSANDSAYLVAEFLNNGDVPGFVEKMNTRARELGMTNTTFFTPHGLRNAEKKDSLSSALDMVILGEALMHYPQLLTWSSTRMDWFRDGKTELKNHNNLVFQQVKGVDGLKTGFLNSSGFCVTISCLRDGRRTLACVTGFTRFQDRDAFSKALLDWGYDRLAVSPAP